MVCTRRLRRRERSGLGESGDAHVILLFYPLKMFAQLIRVLPRVIATRDAVDHKDQPFSVLFGIFDHLVHAFSGHLAARPLLMHPKKRKARFLRDSADFNPVFADFRIVRRGETATFNAGILLDSDLVFSYVIKDCRAIHF